MILHLYDTFLYFFKDYIGKKENITDVLKIKGSTLMKIKLESLRYVYCHVTTHFKCTYYNNWPANLFIS